MSATPRRSPSGRTVRPDIQALRAVAVVLVVLTHAWPDTLSGGSLGVDVFFVISGYLITSLLVEERSRRGAIAIGVFYLRRVARLLPAALTVILVTAVATPENPPYAAPKPMPVETTETSRKVEETTTTTKPTQGAAEAQTPA